MTCFEIRALSSLGARACPVSCPHLGGPPLPLPCEEELSAFVPVRPDTSILPPGCRRVPFLRNPPVDEYLDP